MKSSNKENSKKIEEYVAIIKDYANGQASEFNTTQVLLMFGDDFSHPEAWKSYELMD